MAKWGSSMSDIATSKTRLPAKVHVMRNPQLNGSMQRSLRAGALAALALGLAGCAATQQASYPIVANDYHDQFPITLGQGRHVLDIFPASHRGGIDAATQARITEFVRLYRQQGQRAILMQLPRGAAEARSVDRAAGFVRRELDRAGGRVQTSSYEVVNPNLAAPIRLSFTMLKASVARACGQWPSDLASGTSMESNLNQPYYNYGCSQQKMLAAEVADPRDLVGPQAQTPSDMAEGVIAIEKIRQGTDPGTHWNTGVTNISTAVQ